MCLLILYNIYPLETLWVTIPLWGCEMLSVTFWKWMTGRLVSEFAEASWSWKTTSDPASSIRVMSQVTETIRSFLKPEAPPWQKANCLASVPLLHLLADCMALPQSWKHFCEDGMSLRVGSSCSAPAKPKEVRLDKQVIQRARSRLSYWKALPLF